MNFDQAFREQFKDIRCYTDDELPAALAALDESGRLGFVLETVFGSRNLDIPTLLSKTSIESLQYWLQDELVPIISSSWDSLTVKGLTNLDSNVPYIFVSNHRDIAMDPLVVNIALYRSGFKSTHNAIGDNLLLSLTATRMALANKCFKVARSIRSPKAMLIALRHQSKYIKKLKDDFNESIWIAQSEGRALNSVDKTNPALIKMLSLAEPYDNYRDLIARLNIVPVSISYEWDPCALAKAKRLSSGMTLEPDQKLAQDKLETLIGIKSDKGKINISFGSPLQVDTEGLTKSSFAMQIATAIDREIYNGYELFPINTAALKLTTADATSLCEDEIKAIEKLSSHAQFDFLEPSDNEGLSPALQQLLLNYSQPARLQNLS